MVIPCYTCKQDITFDKNIKSASGKPIPLWPDKLNTHSHDEDGNPVRQPLPPQYQYQQQQQQQAIAQQQYQQRVSNKLQTELGGTAPSQGGSYLDTKRIRVMLQDFQSTIESLQMDIRGLNERLEANTQIDTNKLIGQLQQIYDFMAKVEQLPQTKTAAELYQQKGEQDSSLINHAAKADEFERMKQFTKEDEDDDYDEEDQTKGRATGGVED